MKVNLNLSTTPLETNRRFIAGTTLAGIVAVVALVALSINVARTWRQNRQERSDISRYERQIAQFQQERHDLESFFSAPDTHQVMDRAAFVNALIDQRSFPWTKVFMDLEQTLPGGVRVVSIAPRMEKDHVEIMLAVGATSDESKLKFLKALDDSPAFSHVIVRSETRPNRPEEGDQVQLDLTTWYSGSWTGGAGGNAESEH